MKDNYLIYIAPIIRLILVLIGGKGAISEEDTTQIIGAVTILATLGWSIYEKRHGVKRVNTAEDRADVAEVKAEVAKDQAIKAIIDNK